MATLNLIYKAVEQLDIVDGDKQAALRQIGMAISELVTLQQTLDEFQVKGRTNVDTLLGCMLEIDKMTGEDNG